MAQYAAEGNKDNTDYTDVTIFSVGAAFDYIIPSFHVLSVRLVEVKLQWEDLDTEIFDGFIRECDHLRNVELPAIARLLHGCRSACFVEVRILVFKKRLGGLVLLFFYTERRI